MASTAVSSNSPEDVTSRNFLDYSQLSGSGGTSATTQQQDSTRKVSPSGAGTGTAAVLSISTTASGKTVASGNTASASDIVNNTVSLAATSAADTADYSTAAEIAQKLFNSSSMQEVNRALVNKINNEDKSFESLDVLKNPGNYTPRQRFIMYLDLLQNQAKYTNLSQAFRDNQYGINNGVEINDDFKNAIQILGSDPEVQSLLTQETFKLFNSLFSGVPVAAQDTSGMDKDEIDAANTKRWDDIVALRKEVLDSFDRDIVNGGLLTGGLAEGKSVKEISDEYNAALSLYTMILPQQSKTDQVPADWPGLSNERMEKAQKTYSDFFAKNVVENLPDTYASIKGLLQAGSGGALDEKAMQGVGSVIPIVDASQLRLGGPIFDTVNVDYDGLLAVAKRDKNYKDGDNTSNLFRPTVEVMAKQYFGSGDDKKADRELFTQAVLTALDPLLQKAATQKMTATELQGELLRVDVSKLPSGMDARTFRNVMGTALEGLVYGASTVSSLPPKDGTAIVTGADHFKANSVADIIAGIASSTGLAGQGISASANPANDRQTDSVAFSGIATRMFGTKDGAWSDEVMRSNPATVDADEWTKSMASMATRLSDFVKGNVQGESKLVIAPLVISGADQSAGLSKILSPSIEALAQTYFKDNQTALTAYKANITTLISAAWSLMRPGGSIETLKNQLTELVGKTVTTPPAGVGLENYRESLIAGVTGILNGARAVWAGTNLNNPTWDNIGIVVLHSMSSLASVLKGAGLAVEQSKSFLGSLFQADAELVAAERRVVSSMLKNTATVLSGVGAVAWAPVEFYQFFKAVRDGTDTGSLIFMGVGTAADTVGAVEGAMGIAELLADVTFARGGTLAATAASPFLPLAFSTMFTGAVVVSWAAWVGYTLYNVALQEKKFNESRDALDQDLTRLLDNKTSLYVIKSDQTDRHGVPYKDDNEERVLTPTDWTAIRAGVEEYRKSEGYTDASIPT
ncbi:hypothetical protein ACQ3G6_06730 [Allorhizobium undicola]|uniref:hypothetical protein n=1 Tax=Allorhizobium undicola TaxID=78527 RepID=UPI003D337295